MCLEPDLASQLCQCFFPLCSQASCNCFQVLRIIPIVFTGIVSCFDMIHCSIRVCAHFSVRSSVVYTLFFIFSVVLGNSLPVSSFTLFPNLQDIVIYFYFFLNTEYVSWWIWNWQKDVALKSVKRNILSSWTKDSCNIIKIQKLILRANSFLCKEVLHKTCF